MREYKTLLKKAKIVLNKNWTGNFTKPSPKLYPHQWGWDSGFVSIGYANYNPSRAEKELLSLFEGQWKNGMVPHIVFNKRSKGYFPGPKYWNIKTSKNAPKNKQTSAITQPPTQAIAAYKIYQQSKGKREVKKFLRKIYPKILSFHRYLHTERDPEKSGLVTIVHPWESGSDDSPRWDEALSRINPKNLPKYRRTDLDHVHSSSERPTNKQYDRYIYIIETLRKCCYDIKRIYRTAPFLVKDVVFNSILYIANRDLIEIGKITGDDTSEIEKWNNKMKKKFTKYFCLHIRKNCEFYDYDLIKKKHIIKKSISSLIPLYTGLLTQHQAKTILGLLNKDHFCGTGTCKYLAAPSIDIHSPDFTAVTYWRGPIWINMNWMLYQGLRHYKFHDRAFKIKDSIIKLVDNHGFYEYFDPFTGKGIGGNNFSWTAALLIDLLME